MFLRERGSNTETELLVLPKRGRSVQIDFTAGTHSEREVNKLRLVILEQAAGETEDGQQVNVKINETPTPTKTLLIGHRSTVNPEIGFVVPWRRFCKCLDVYWRGEIPQEMPSFGVLMMAVENTVRSCPELSHEYTV